MNTTSQRRIPLTGRLRRKNARPGVVDVGGMNHRSKQIAHYIKDNMAFASFCFFPPVKASLFTCRHGFDALGINDAVTWLWFSSAVFPGLLNQMLENGVPESGYSRASLVSNCEINYHNVFSLFL